MTELGAVLMVKLHTGEMAELRATEQETELVGTE